MDIVDLFVILGGAYIVFRCGEMYGYWTFYKVIDEYLKTKGIDLKNELENHEGATEAKESKPEQSSVYKLETHEENNVLYLYNRDNNSFICQAPNIEELAKLAKQYKNITKASVLHGGKVFVFIDGTAQEYK